MIPYDTQYIKMKKMIHDTIHNLTTMDMLIKRKEESAHLDDLKETFATFRLYQMKLNPSKTHSR